MWVKDIKQNNIGLVIHNNCILKYNLKLFFMAFKLDNPFLQTMYLNGSG